MPWPSMKAIMSSFMLVRSSGMGDILGSEYGCKLLLYALPRIGATFQRPGRTGHEAHKHAIKLLRVEVKLDLDKLSGRVDFFVRGPGQRVSVAGAVIHIDTHISSITARDDARIDPGRGG